MSSNIVLILLWAAATISRGRLATDLGSPIAMAPEATEMSVVVSLVPPKTRASEVIRYPTDSGPTRTPPCGPGLTRDPPPKPMLIYKHSVKRGAHLVT